MGHGDVGRCADFTELGRQVALACVARPRGDLDGGAMETMGLGETMEPLGLVNRCSHTSGLFTRGTACTWGMATWGDALILLSWTFKPTWHGWRARGGDPDDEAV